MFACHRRAAAALFIALSLTWLHAADAGTGTSVPEQQVEPRALQEVLATWSQLPRNLALELSEKYGPPDAITGSFLVWVHRGAWHTMILRRDGIPHNLPWPHMDHLEQSILYRVPADKFDELAAFDGSITARRTSGEISAMCDREEMNIAALNLAHALVRGTITVAQARRALGATALALFSGQRPRITQQLLFPQAALVQARDPDVAILR
jgi:hypothetical protein